MLRKLDELLVFLDGYDRERNNDTAPIPRKTKIHDYSDHTGEDVDMIIDDLWIEIFFFIDIKDFLSICQTCKHFHFITKEKDNTNRISQYWKLQCQLLCSNFCHQFKHYNSSKYKSIYIELVTIFTNVIRLKFDDDCLSIHGSIPLVNEQNIHHVKRFLIERKFENENGNSNGEDIYNCNYNDGLVKFPLLWPSVTVSINYVPVLQTPITQVIAKDHVNVFKMMIETNNICKDLMDKGNYHSFVINLSIESLFNPKDYYTGNQEYDESQFDLSMYEWNLFCRCCYYGSVKILNYLLSLPNITTQFDNCTNNDIKKQALKDRTPLMIAIKNEKTEIVKKLVPYVSKYHNINAKDKYGWTALYHATRNIRSPDNIRYEMIKLLIDHGADVNIKTCRGYTCLWEACCLGNFVVIKYLMNAHHQRNILLENNMDTLMNDKLEYAFISLIKSINLIRDIYSSQKEKFAKEKAKTIDFVLGFNYNCHSNENGSQSAMQRFSTMKDLLGNTALHCAVDQLDEEICKILNKHKCFTDINMQNKDGLSPLMLCCRNKYGDEKIVANIVELLISQGAEINYVSENCLGTPLMEAILCKHVAVVKVLLEKGFTNIYWNKNVGMNAIEWIVYQDKFCQETWSMLQFMCNFLMDHPEKFGGAQKIVNYIQQSKAGDIIRRHPSQWDIDDNDCKEKMKKLKQKYANFLTLVHQRVNRQAN